MENRKSKMTKRLLYVAVTELLQDYPLEKISVKLLCDKADINRSTFYAHYEDISSLISEIKNDYISSHLGFLYTLDSFNKDEFEAFLRDLKKQQEKTLFFTLANNTTMVNEASDVMRSSVTRYFEGRIGKINEKLIPVVNCEIDYLIYGMAYSVGRWLADGCPYDEKYVADSIFGKIEDILLYLDRIKSDFS